MGRKLDKGCQLVQVPDDAGSVSGSTHQDTVGCGGGQAGDRLCVPVQRLGNEASKDHNKKRNELTSKPQWIFAFSKDKMTIPFHKQK